VDLISQKLVDLALQNETDDNASVVVLHLKKLTASPVEQDSRRENNWLQSLRKFLP